MTEPTEQPTHAAKPRRGRKRRLLLSLALLAGAFLVLAPVGLGKWGRARIESTLSERLNGTATVESFHFAWNGKLRLEGVEVVDEGGELVALLPETRFDLGLRSLMTGKKDVALVCSGAQVELVQDEEGRWNVEGLLKETESGSTGDDGGAEGEGLPETPPDLEGRLELLDATVTFRSPRSVLEVRGVELRIGLDGSAREYTIEGEGAVFGGEGDAGRFVVDGALWPDARAGVRVDELGIQGLDLGVVQEALSLLDQPLEEGSRLAGQIDFSTSGHLRGFDAEAPFVLEGAVSARDLDVELVQDGATAFAFDDPAARFELALQRVAQGDEPSAVFSLDAKSGGVLVQGGWDGAAEADPFRASAQLAGLDASAGIDRLLARVHPVFAGASAFEGAALDGVVSADLSFVYEEPLTLEQLIQGAAGIDENALSAVASFSIAEGLVTTSPLFGELLTALGEPAAPTFDLSPLGVQLSGGKVRYTQPWTWTIDGAETRFEGGVGLDGGLELDWVVPVTGGLAKQNRVFEAIAGETFKVPLGGTLTAPRLDITGALGQLAVTAGQRALEKETAKLKDEARSKLEDALGDEAGGLVDDLLGGKTGADAVRDAARGAIGGALGGTEDAAGLLKKADRLWKEGKKQEAAAIYKRIRKDFPLSPTYLLNKKRIKSRRNG